MRVTKTATPTISSHADVLVILSTLVATRLALGYQFQAVGSTGPFLTTSLGFTHAQIGMLIGLFSAPGWLVCLGYGAFQRSGVTDRFATIIALSVMTAGASLSALGWDLPSVGAGRLACGLGGAYLLIAMSKMVTEHFLTNRLLLAMSLFVVGWPGGIAVGQVLQPVIATHFGWRAVFATSAALLAFCTLCFVTAYRDPTGQAPRGDAVPLNPSEIKLVSLAGLAWMGINSVYIVLLGFAPARLIEQGSSVVEASQTVSVMSWAALIAIPAGGYLSDYLRKPTMVLIVALGVSLVALLLIISADSGAIEFAAFGLALGISTPIVAALPAEFLRPQSRGAGLSLFYVWFYAGTAIFPLLAGVVVDHTGSAAGAIVLASVVMLFVFVLIALWRGPGIVEERTPAPRSRSNALPERLPNRREQYPSRPVPAPRPSTVQARSSLDG